jgi:LysR family transcriptional regulator, carnitine catabolism transcriptional activator
MVLNALDTQIAMVEAGEGIAVIPSFGLPACRNRKVVMIRLVNPVVPWTFTRSEIEAENSLQLPKSSRQFSRATSLDGLDGPDAMSSGRL